YNTGHLFGFFSVFNADAIKSVTLHKGNMPAQYGGRLSSVLDFHMKDGNYKKYQATGGIGLISSRLTLEGPIVKDKGSFIVSGRRTYIDIISKPFVESNGVKGVPYFFYDLNIKANYKIGLKDQLFFSSYIGRDQVKLGLLDGRLQSNIFWGNKTGTLKWNHRFSSKLNMNVSAIYNDYNFVSKATFDNFDTQVDSRITDRTLKVAYDYYPGIRHKIQFGFLYTFHTFTPRRAAGSASGVTFNGTSNPEKYAQDAAIYLSDQYTISEKLDVAVGIRLNTFRQVGPYSFITNSPRDTTTFSKGQPIVTFLNPEPRVGIRYKLNSTSSLKAAYNLNNQYIHQVSLSGNALPFDIWVASSKLIKPQRASQYSIGYFRNLFENSFEFSIEAYYKNLTNQIEYRQDYVPRVSGEIENEFVFGRGKSYGLEFFLNKKAGKFQGWIGYTLAKATRKFEKINGGKEFSAKYDRRHDINIIGTYVLNEKWTIGGTFVFASGQPITIPERRYLVEGVIYNQYGLRNSYRMQDYHRLDLSATYSKKRPNRRLESSWTFAVYNVYNRKNPYIYFIDADGNPISGELVVKAKKMFLFPILPSITWNFKF
ncbi:MAG TPA: TonB-dependent receptor, partial [Cytophagaceae bacterium]